MTTALEGGEGSASRLGRSLPLGKTLYPFYRRLGFPVVIQHTISIIFRLLCLFSNSAQGVQLFICSNVSCYLPLHYSIRLSVYLPSCISLFMIPLFSLYSFYFLLDCMVQYLCILLTSIYFFHSSFSVCFIRN